MGKDKMLWMGMRRCGMVLCLGALGIGAQAQEVASAAAASAKAQISVSGDAVVRARPDQVVIAMGVETVHDQIASSKRQNAAIVVAAIAAVKQAGVADEAIQIDQLQIEPRYRDTSMRQGLVSYITRNAFTVTVDHPAKVEAVVSAALQAGVNYVHGVEFRTTALRQRRDEARVEALKAARDKAELMAAALGRRIGQPVQITEGRGGWDYLSGSRYWGHGYGHGAVSQNVMVAEDGMDAPAAAHLGEIAVSANVHVVFELVD